jgi:hypothetical protein
MAISDSSYAAAISRLERDVNDENWPQVWPDHLCLITIRSDKRI